MNITFLIALFLTASSADTGDNNVTVVSLIDGVEMQIAEIPYSRILPFAYYDQALSSILGLYPNAEIVAKRRYGHLGNDHSTAYSMICYKESFEYNEVTISGVVVHIEKAWRYEARVNANHYNDMLMLVIEKISAAPFNNLLQRAR
jgi:hypothetical protein